MNNYVSYESLAGYVVLFCCRFLGVLDKDDFQPYVEGHLPEKLSEMKANVSNESMKDK